MANGVLFTGETYARGDQAYIAAVAAGQAATDAMQTASGAEDGLITTFFSATQPVGQTNGDLWFNISDNNKIYRWQGDFGNVARTNYCPNPSAQYNSTGWTATRGTLSADDSVLSGDRASWRVLITDTSVVGDASQNLSWGGTITASATQQWACSALVRSSALSAITKYKARIIWLNATNTVLGTTEGDQFTASTPDSWVKVLVTGAAPSGTTKFGFQVGPADSGEIQASDAFWVNDVVFEQGSDTGVFFSGAMTPALWTGAAGNSTSGFTPVWVPAADQRIAQALTDANNAAIAAGNAATAAGLKINTYFASTAPSATAIGDLWVDTGNQNKLWRATALGTGGWVSAQDGTIAVAQQKAVDAFNAANDKNKVYYQTTLPGTTANSAGDIWYQFSALGTLVGMWIGQGGTSWQVQAIQDTVLGNINGAKITAYSLSTKQINVGVLRKNPINNSGYEETYTWTNWASDPNRGDNTQWRRNYTTNAFVTIATGVANSGNRVASMTINSGGGINEFAYMYTNAFQVQAGQSYKVRFATVATGSGGASTQLFVHAFFGTAADTVNSGALDQNLVSFEPTGDAYYIPPYTANPPTPTDYTTYVSQMDIPAGQTDLWCVIRYRMTNSPANSTIYIDDTSVIQMGIGGAMELTAAGLRLFDDNGDEAVVLVTNRPSTVNVTSNGNVVAAINNDGSANFMDLSVNDDPQFMGQPMLGRDGTDNQYDNIATYDPTRSLDLEPVGSVEGKAQGYVAEAWYANNTFSSTIITSGGRIQLWQMDCTLYSNRQYYVITTPITINVTTVGGFALLVYRAIGANPTVSSELMARVYIRATTTGWHTLQLPYRPIAGTNAVNDTRLLFVITAETGGAFQMVAIPDGVGSAVIDVGFQKNRTGTLRNQITQPAGTDPAPPAVQKTYTSTWGATNSQTRRGTSGFGSNTINPTSYTGSQSMLAGYYSTSNGNQYAFAEFNGANSTGSETSKTVAQALTGATVTKVEIYVKNSSFYASTGGSQRFGMTALTAISTATTLVPPATTYTGNVAFTSGAGKWVTLPSAANSVVKNGGRVFMIGPGTSNSTTYYSKWVNHVPTAGRPALRITYTK